MAEMRPPGSATLERPNSRFLTRFPPSIGRSTPECGPRGRIGETCMSPPCLRAISRAMASPRPEPPVAREREASRRKNRSMRRGRPPAGSPALVVHREESAPARGVCEGDRTVPFSGPWRSALSTRFPTSCSRSSPEPWTFVGRTSAQTTRAPWSSASVREPLVTATTSRSRSIDSRSSLLAVGQSGEEEELLAAPAEPVQFRRAPRRWPGSSPPSAADGGGSSAARLWRRRSESGVRARRRRRSAAPRPPIPRCGPASCGPRFDEGLSSTGAGMRSTASGPRLRIVTPWSACAVRDTGLMPIHTMKAAAETENRRMILRPRSGGGAGTRRSRGPCDRSRRR